jgi:hypothetical protein
MRLVFLNPSALFLLAGITIPVIVHLLVRREARRRSFPSLRFVSGRETRAARLRQLSDWRILLLRAGTIAAAVVALAGPLLVTPAREARWGREVSRVVVVDTSGSAASAARAAAARTLDGAKQSVLIETRRPGEAIDAAIEAARRLPPSQQELVIVSDFQEGALDGVAWTSVPDHLGVRLVRVSREAIAGVTAPQVPAVRVAGDEQEAARIARSAVATVTGFPDTGPANVVVWGRNAEAFGREVSAAVRVQQPWMAGVVGRVRADPQLQDAFRGVPAETLGGLPSSWTPLVERDRSVMAAAAQSGDRLFVVTSAPPETLAFPTLLLALSRALVDRDGLRERLLPTRTSADSQYVERPSTGVLRDSIRNATETDSRWWWIAAGAMLWLEQRLRRNRAAARAVPAERAA